MAQETIDHAKAYTFKAEMKQLLHLIVHSLYTHPEIFLRELISNASDAINKARFQQLTDPNTRQPEAPFRIDITLDKEAQTLTLTDTGIGMTESDLVDRIGTVASSGTLAFLEQLQSSEKPLDAQLIGQFGVGFYAAFMVADRITIETLHADPQSQGYRWSSDGLGTFTIEPIDREDRGTSITLHLKDDAKDFTESYRVRQVIRKYSNFVDFPIFLEDEQVNTVKALWRKSKGDVTEEERKEFYTFISADPAEPLGHLHLNIEGRLNFNALLFIPSKAPAGLFREEYERNLHLYANNVFIQDDCKALLPEYLRFVRGVVDTDDLPLNVSREVTQDSPVMAKVNKILTKRILGLLKEWATQDPERYQTFFEAFGALFKAGLTSDFLNREKLMELMRYASTKTEEGALTGFDDYVSRMPEDQEEIYYLLGEQRETALRNPNLEVFKRKDIEVLLMLDPVDVFTISAMGTFADKPLVSIEKADLKIEQDAETAEDALDTDSQAAILAQFKAQLGDRVEDVVATRRLVDSAVTLVVGKEGLDAQMEHMMRMMNEDLGDAKKILEVNPAHPLIKNIAALQAQGAKEAVVGQAIEQLFEGALLMNGALRDPGGFVARMTALMVEATGGAPDDKA